MQYTQSSLHCFVPDTIELSSTGDGALTGTTFALKDCFSVAGHVSSFGHPAWRQTHEASAVTAPVVQSLLEAGSSLVGLTKMDQLAYSLVGNVGEGEAPVNPLYSNRFTGGSSSGTASAIAGGLADIGIGTDTGGSIRIPAAACGLYSLRPTHGRISLRDALPLAQSFDTVGICTRDPEILSQAFSVIRGEAKQSVSIGTVLVVEELLAGINPDVADGVHAIAQQVTESLGIRRTSLLKSDLGTPTDAGELLARMQSREIWHNHGEWVSTHKQSLAQDVQSRMEVSRHRAEALADEATKESELQVRYQETFAQVVPVGTVSVLPVMEGLPPLRDASAEDLAHFRKVAFGLSAVAGLAGAPEVVLPWQHPRSGQTVGIGFVSAFDTDETLLEAVNLWQRGKIRGINWVMYAGEKGGWRDEKSVQRVGNEVV